MKIQQTKRRFYNKWLHKVSVKIGAGAVFFRTTAPKISAKYASNPLWSQLHTALDSVDSNLWAIRVEHQTVDVYTNSSEFFNQVIDQFDGNVVHAFAPPKDQEHLLGDTKTIIANKYPFDRYQYKVYLNPHKLVDRAAREAWVTWLDSQGDRVRISSAVKAWFIKTNWNWDRRYMYVQDEQTLLMLKMRDSAAIGSVYSHVIVDK
jgi:hypothetical protein